MDCGIILYHQNYNTTVQIAAKMSSITPSIKNNGEEVYDALKNK